MSCRRTEIEHARKAEKGALERRKTGPARWKSVQKWALFARFVLIRAESMQERQLEGWSHLFFVTFVAIWGDI